MRPPRTVLLAAAGLILALAAPACRRGGGAGDAATPRDLATGGCLGPFCIGHAPAEAERPEQAAAIVSGAPAGGVTCWRLDRIDVAAFADAADKTSPIRGVLATSLPFCGAHPSLASATSPDIVDCRGVRLGDPQAFVTKMHRQARPVVAGDDLWPERPAGVTGISDICTPAADSAHRTTLYLQDDRVVGIGIGRR